MATTTFSSAVDAWTRKTDKRLTAVFRESAQRTADIAQTPTTKGGKMRIDTNFLRNSFDASLSGMPTGPSRQGEPQGNPANVDLVIAGARIGDVIHMGWTANYARPREYKDGFMRSAAQLWPQTVAKAIADAKARFP